MPDMFSTSSQLHTESLGHFNTVQRTLEETDGRQIKGTTGTKEMLLSTGVDDDFFFSSHNVFHMLDINQHTTTERTREKGALIRPNGPGMNMLRL